MTQNMVYFLNFKTNNQHLLQLPFLLQKQQSRNNNKLYSISSRMMHSFWHVLNSCLWFCIKDPINFRDDHYFTPHRIETMKQHYEKCIFSVTHFFENSTVGQKASYCYIHLKIISCNYVVGFKGRKVIQGQILKN